MSYVAHAKHSRLFGQPLALAVVRVTLYVAAIRLSSTTEWDTVGKCYWILNVHPFLLALALPQLKIEVDMRMQKKTAEKKQIVITDQGPMLV